MSAPIFVRVTNPRAPAGPPSQERTLRPWEVHLAWGAGCVGAVSLVLLVAFVMGGDVLDGVLAGAAAAFIGGLAILATLLNKKPWRDDGGDRRTG